MLHVYNNRSLLLIIEFIIVIIIVIIIIIITISCLKCMFAPLKSDNDILFLSLSLSLLCLYLLSSSLSLTHSQETEINLAHAVERGSLPKADPSQFELVKVLGQGSFGKV